MEEPRQILGHAVFLRTDTVDYAEEEMVFRNLEEMVALCSRNWANLVLDRVIVYSMAGAEACAVTLGFISASKGKHALAPPVLEN